MRLSAGTGSGHNPPAQAQAAIPDGMIPEWARTTGF
jgi:hypothetical protein